MRCGCPMAPVCVSATAAFRDRLLILRHFWNRLFESYGVVNRWLLWAHFCIVSFMFNGRGCLRLSWLVVSWVKLLEVTLKQWYSLLIFRCFIQVNFESPQVLLMLSEDCIWLQVTVKTLLRLFNRLEYFDLMMHILLGCSSRRLQGRFSGAFIDLLKQLGPGLPLDHTIKLLRCGLFFIRLSLLF